MNHWLLKSDPLEFSWDNLKAQPGKKTFWDGVRNYQARNFLREMRKGDLAFFYHSVIKPQCITGIVKIIKEAYPDYTQFDKNHPNYDPKSNEQDPTWFMVDVQVLEEFSPPISRDEIKSIKEMQDMVLFRNSRLSVQPVTPGEWQRILQMKKGK
jgi:predicted RNA-binding protein with PUA-like domain